MLIVTPSIWISSTIELVGTISAGMTTGMTTRAALRSISILGDATDTIHGERLQLKVRPSKKLLDYEKRPVV